jgi:hypothetical protein
MSFREDREFADSLLEGTGFEPVWGFFCQVVIFGLLAVLCPHRADPVRASIEEPNLFSVTREKGDNPAFIFRHRDLAFV